MAHDPRLVDVVALGIFSSAVADGKVPQVLWESSEEFVRRGCREAATAALDAIEAAGCAVVHVGLLSDLLAWVAPLPVKHPQQAALREQVRAVLHPPRHDNPTLSCPNSTASNVAMKDRAS